MAWRSNRSVAVQQANEPTPGAIVAQLKQLGVTNEFLTYLRERNHALDQVLLFFQSGGQLADLEMMTGFRTVPSVGTRADLKATASAMPLHTTAPAPEVKPAVQPGLANVQELPVSPVRKPRAKRHEGATQPSGDELIAHGGLTRLFGLAVIANGLGTIMGVVSLAPRGAAWLVGAVVIGIGLHIIISRIEVAYMQWRYIRSWFVVPLIGAILLDVGTSVQGFLWLSGMVVPALFADGLPRDIWQWGILFQTNSANVVGFVYELAGEQVDWSMLQPPVWAGRARTILILISGISVGSERLFRWSYHRFWEACQQR